MPIFLGLRSVLPVHERWRSPAAFPSQLPAITFELPSVKCNASFIYNSSKAKSWGPLSTLKIDLKACSLKERKPISKLKNSLQKMPLLLLLHTFPTTVLPYCQTIQIDRSFSGHGSLQLCASVPPFLCLGTKPQTHPLAILHFLLSLTLNTNQDLAESFGQHCADKYSPSPSIFLPPDCCSSC